MYTLTGKPNSLHDSADGEEDGMYLKKLLKKAHYKLVFLSTTFSLILFFFCPVDNFLEVIKKSSQTPVKKFQFPQTSAQEVGWNTDPLVSCW